MLEKIITPANTTKFSQDLMNVTYPKDSPDMWIEWGGSFTEVVPKEECLRYVHQNCTLWGTIWHISLAVCVLLFALGVFYMISYLKYHGKL